MLSLQCKVDGGNQNQNLDRPDVQSMTVCVGPSRRHRDGLWMVHRNNSIVVERQTSVKQLLCIAQKSELADF
ncbi:hypothetical protein [Ralstonia sp. A12]|uniref:hypothetical protein n=1 Tax=Ralstonia sp. A12 TaxID=1217052 RepID=UPI0012ED7CE3|nr:hypothetical protein [Ralstonia sp. A12]